jgi:hypothetical protein
VKTPSGQRLKRLDPKEFSVYAEKSPSAIAAVAVGNHRIAPRA